MNLRIAKQLSQVISFVRIFSMFPNIGLCVHCNSQVVLFIFLFIIYFFAFSVVFLFVCLFFLCFLFVCLFFCFFFFGGGGVGGGVSVHKARNF